MDGDVKMFKMSKKGMSGIDIGVDVALLVIGILLIAVPILKEAISDTSLNFTATEQLVLGAVGVLLIVVVLARTAKYI
jgi:hypothetical protein